MIKIRTVRLKLIGLLLAVMLWSVTAVPALYAQATSLLDAIASNSVTVSATGLNASYAQPMIQLMVTNEFVTPLTLTVPNGLRLSSNGDSFADILIAETATIQLEPNTSQAIQLVGYSLDHTGKLPDTTAVYSVVGLETDATLQMILQRIDQEGLAGEYGSQLAIWMQVSGLNYNRLTEDLGNTPSETQRRQTVVLLSESPTAVWQLVLGENLWWVLLVIGGMLLLTAVLIRQALNTRILDGKYRIVGERIQLDGYYEIYQARRLFGFDRQMLTIKTPVSERGVLRCEREIEIRGRLATHWNIMPLVDSGREQVETWLFPRPYMVEPFMRGRTLSRLVERKGPQALSRVEDIIRELLDALEYIHGRGYVHGNIKPSSILLDRNKVVHLMNFGTDLNAEFPNFNIYESQNFREFAWFAPEHLQRVYLFAQGEKDKAEDILVDVRLDIYAVGVLIYFLFVGDVPFAPESFMVPGKAPQPIFLFPTHVPEHIQNVVRRCMQPSPQARYRNVGTLRKALSLQAAAEEIDFGTALLAE
ncbi:MAG: serine/threonine-protein kinase [Chloroflexota bacterium]